MKNFNKHTSKLVQYNPSHENDLNENNESNNFYNINLPDWSEISWLKDSDAGFLDQAAMLVESFRIQRQLPTQVVGN